MNRLYRWLQARATFFRTGSHDGRRVVRTQVTVEEEQRTVLLSVHSIAGLCVCPLCGHTVTPLPGERAAAVTLEHSQVHEHCPGPGQADDEKDPRLGKPGDIRRLR